MMVRRYMTTPARHWGSDKTEDREYAKALRDHAGSGSTVPLVGVEYGVELDGDSVTSNHFRELRLLVDLDSDRWELVVAIYNFLKQRGDL